jgi:tripartite-type tricarboxylate transporter receptor subunit TctC
MPVRSLAIPESKENPMSVLLSRRFVAAFLIACGMLIAGAAPAQEYPVRPVKIIVGFAPGGATDQIARLLAKNLQAKWDQPFVVENRSGAGGNIAHDAVAKAPADGYTLLFTSAPLTINPSLYKNLPYDPIRDFAPVTLVATVPSLLLVPASSKLHGTADLLAFARAHPGQLNYGSAGNGTPQHLAMELLKSLAGISIVHIPYKGGAPAVADLVAGQTDLMFAAFPEAIPYVKSGRLRALGISTSKRFSLMPELPTIAESGVPGFQAVGWQGLLAPAATPKPIVEQLNAAIAEALAGIELRDRLEAMGLDLSGIGPAPFRAFMLDEIDKWSKVVAQSGARID